MQKTSTSSVSRQSHALSPHFTSMHGVISGNATGLQLQSQSQPSASGFDSNEFWARKPMNPGLDFTWTMISFSHRRQLLSSVMLTAAPFVNPNVPYGSLTVGFPGCGSRLELWATPLTQISATW